MGARDNRALESLRVTPTQETPTAVRSASNGAGDETRTRDSQHGKLVLYQLSYSRSKAAASLTGPLRVSSYIARSVSSRIL
jgi:hypothetical protein